MKTSLLTMHIFQKTAWSLMAVFSIIGCVVGIDAQRIAIVAPLPNDLSSIVVRALNDSLQPRLLVVHEDVAADAFRSVQLAAPFNQTKEEAKQLGAVIGSDLILLVRAASQRRSSFEKVAYYEAFAAFYLVSSRTGRLALFRLESRTADIDSDAAAQLIAAIDVISDVIVANGREATGIDRESVSADRFPEYPADNDPQKTGLRPPMPFNRIKPEYTATAFIYEIAATVDVEVSIDARGEVVSVEIVRWAGYGLEEAVVTAVRSMNWRAGEKKGTSLPMRVLLRYNFKKIDKDDTS